MYVRRDFLRFTGSHWVPGTTLRTCCLRPSKNAGGVAGDEVTDAPLSEKRDDATPPE